MNDMTNQGFQSYYGTEAYEPVERYTAKTFGWMFLGLLVTFFVSIAGYQTGAVWYVVLTPYAPFILAIAEIVVVMYLSARVHKMSVGKARALFFLYAILNGVVFSAYFVIYNVVDLVLVFAATSLFFGVMAVIGYVTRADLSKLRNFLVAGVLFLAASGFLESLSMYRNLS